MLLKAEEVVTEYSNLGRGWEGMLISIFFSSEAQASCTMKRNLNTRNQC